VACVNGSVALIECIEHEYAWLKKLASNVICEETKSICYYKRLLVMIRPKLEK
jgi:hypothetical protein